MRELSDLPLVCVIWGDAHGAATGEYTLEDIAREVNQPTIIRTFGLLACDDERGVTLVSEVTSEAEPVTYRGTSHVPRAMVREVIPLGVPKRPAKRKATP
ncbi:MAG TPA: hypothetical protein VEA69_01360 [Tepidisphaeraceae bacterium]|nr:hypothetical protein [Tepidisphaeraceae bacterium]